MFSSQGERTFSEEEEEKLQGALSLNKQALNLVLETSAFILEQVSKGPLSSCYFIGTSLTDCFYKKKMLSVIRRDILLQSVAVLSIDIQKID